MLLYKKPGIAADQLLYRDFNKEAVYKALARKGETLKHLWQKYNAVGIVDGKKPMSYRQYCRRYSEWVDSKQLTFHIQRYPGVNLELDYAGKQLYLHNRRNPEETTKVTIFIAALTYSDYNPHKYSHSGNPSTSSRYQRIPSNSPTPLHP